MNIQHFSYVLFPTAVYSKFLDNSIILVSVKFLFQESFFLMKHKKTYLCISWLFSSILTLFLSCFKGGNCVGNMCCSCWRFIRWIQESGVFVLPLLKRVCVCFKWCFLLPICRSLNEKESWFAFFLSKSKYYMYQIYNKMPILHMLI